VNAIVALAFVGLINPAEALNDCGASEFASVIGTTQLLVLEKTPLLVPTGPAPGRPNLHCVRLTFRIGGDGRALDVREIASSGNFKLVVSARAALMRYTFDAEHSDPASQYTLVFFEMVD